MHIMLVDDEKILSKHIKSKLKRNWYKVSLVENCSDFFNQSKLEDIDLFLIDISLWDGSWLEILKFIKESNTTRDIPAILVSWHTETALKVEWLDQWADDYIMKPFEFDELLARVRSNLRKKYPHITSSTLKYNSITFETSSREVYKSNQAIDLSKKEKQVLEYLMLHQGICVSKSDLQKMFWKDSKKWWIPENTINVTICNIRKKIWPDLQLKTIVWEWYCLQ